MNERDPAFPPHFSVFRFQTLQTCKCDSGARPLHFLCICSWQLAQDSGCPDLVNPRTLEPVCTIVRLLTSGTPVDVDPVYKYVELVLKPSTEPFGTKNRRKV